MMSSLKVRKSSVIDQLRWRVSIVGDSVYIVVYFIQINRLFELSELSMNVKTCFMFFFIKNHYLDNLRLRHSALRPSAARHFFFENVHGDEIFRFLQNAFLNLCFWNTKYIFR